MKAQFSLAPLYQTTAFNAKCNFVVATAKKFNIKKADAFELADKIEARTTEQLDAQTFKCQFVELAADFIKDQMVLKIITPTHRKKVADLLMAEPVEVEAAAKKKSSKKVTEVDAVLEIL